jgi:hypothetical protein
MVRHLKQGLLIALFISFGTLLYSPDSQNRKAGGIESVKPLNRRSRAAPCTDRSCEISSDWPGTPDPVCDQIDRLLRMQNFNGTVAVARRGEVLYRGSFGMADSTLDSRWKSTISFSWPR